jgi:N-acetylmuramic acid 6-phosphate etherase
MVLNMLTTISMVRIGKTYGNLMVDVQTGSEQRRDRARSIITTVTGLDYEAAGALLRRAHWNVKAGIVMQSTGDTYVKALARLKRADNFVRNAIEQGENAPPRKRQTKRTTKRVDAPHPQR